MTLSNVPMFLLRIFLGWMFLYAGLTKIFDPQWSAAGYLQGAKTFHDFYAFLALPILLPMTNFVNEWGLTLLGISLILGVGMRIATPLGSVLMLLYYLVVLQFPKVGTTSFLVDQHIIYATALLVVAVSASARTWSVATLLKPYMPARLLAILG